MRSMMFPKTGPALFSTTLLAICLTTSATAQTRLDLSAQGRGIDFKTQPYTRPVKTGASLPAICAQGEMFFLTSAPPGSNIYVCPAANIWALQGAATGALGTVTNIATTGPLSGGPITGSGVLSCPACVTNSTPATANAIMLGAGSQAISALGTLGNANTVLHGNSFGAPGFGPVSLATDVTGNLGVANLNNGAAASSATFWRGDGTWAVPPSGGSGSGALTVQSNGTTVGTRGTLNFVPGTGIATFISDTGTQINVQQTIDSAVVQTRANQQSGQTLLCASASGSGNAYTCSMSPVLGSYTLGMIVNWIADVGGAGGATTLNIDTLGATPVKLNDGIANPAASDIVAGRMYLLFFDGNNFRKLL